MYSFDRSLLPCYVQGTCMNSFDMSTLSWYTKGTSMHCFLHRSLLSWYVLGSGIYSFDRSLLSWYVHVTGMNSFDMSSLSWYPTGTSMHCFFTGGFRYVQFWQEFTFYTGISLFSESLMFKLTNSYPPWVATSLPNIQTNLIKLLIFFRDHFQTWQNSQKILTVRWGQIWIQEKKRSAVFGDQWMWNKAKVTKF